MARERWKPVPEWEGIYSVSDRGNVRRDTSGRLLRPFLRRGYPRVCLRSGERIAWLDVHLIVCTAWNGPRPGPDYHASHDDGNRLNNRPKNVLWKTIPENMQDKVRHGTSAAGERNPCAKLTKRKALALVKAEPERVAALAPVAGGCGLAHVVGDAFGRSQVRCWCRVWHLCSS